MEEMCDLTIQQVPPSLDNSFTSDHHGVQRLTGFMICAAVGFVISFGSLLRFVRVRASIMPTQPLNWSLTPCE